MNGILRFIALILLFLLTAPLQAFLTQINSVRLWQESPDSIRLVFDMSAPAEYKFFALSNPERLVIDFKNTTLPSLPQFAETDLLKKIRSAPRHQHDLRVVLDLKQAAQAKTFTIAPADGYGHRLIVQISPHQVASSATKNTLTPPPVKASANPEVKPKKTTPSPVINPSASVPAPILPLAHRAGRRDLIIAVDAGHGGIDPGAIGKNGTREKTVVLAIARELAALINQQPGMQAVLVRDGDYYLKLRQRIDMAREHQADLFISIHADAYEDPTARGASVYMLSRSGASSEAANWLAEKENAADLMGGVSLNDKDDLLASVLLDLSQTGTLEASAHLAESVFNQLKKVGKTHHKRVQQAAFMVLRSPDIPSILVETAFISNLEEERKLNDPHYRSQIARVILDGIKDYAKNHAPPGTVLAKQ
ncbi:N-acetylmuramoyl-L-alanine amidase [Thioflexithrix psekupsensis]|uniref:N-acetylmuramoyl-L-alanine amidase AmiC n=1 Tax=Thioflexithrix psekupsensis TaxID=1570016 RepID=A0A251X695_9GAMM|nr:N-acetylmuramoyl-L-alanine amidase [Thioflexithrix psekupsensis]OUD13158.1 N-acetylmuramoyl-L-alanine amidase [Thioflexithrix psekupsensis]